jgi:hypothetical protein
MFGTHTLPQRRKEYFQEKPYRHCFYTIAQRANAIHHVEAPLVLHPLTKHPETKMSWSEIQYCGPGSRIRCFLDPCIRDPDPGSRIGKKMLEVKKTLIFFMWIRIRDLFDPGSGMEKIASGIHIPDPQHCGNRTGAPTVGGEVPN